MVMRIVQAKQKFLCLLFDFGRFMHLKEDICKRELAGTRRVRSLCHGAGLGTVRETFCPRQDWPQAGQINRGSEPGFF